MSTSAGPDRTLDPDRLRALPDDELLRRLRTLLGGSRRVEADLVAHVGEVDARRLFTREAMPSMFAYCTRVLNLSEQESYLRIAAARAARSHPVLLAMLRDGRLHLSAIARLAPHLTPGNREAVLERATHMSRRQIDELVAELAPRPDVAASVRKLPTRPGAGVRVVRVAGGSPEGLCSGEPAGVSTGAPSGAPTGASTGAATGAATEASAGSSIPSGAALQSAAMPGASHGKSGPAPQLCPDRVAPPRAELRPATGALSPVAAAPPPRSSIQPLAPGRYRVQFTASHEMRDKLERLRELMRTSVPDGDLGAILEAAVTEKLGRLEARRFARTSVPRKGLAETDVTPASHRVPAAVRRAVYERDGGQCAFVDARGRRCPARGRLEFHHRRPFGAGGDHSPPNVSLQCAGHNQALADHDYGREAMARHRSRKAKPSGGKGPSPRAP